MTSNYKGTTVLITGASSGLGAEFAEHFAARGADLVLVARREDRLAALASELESNHGVTATVLARDLAEPHAAEALVDDLSQQSLHVDGLVNNAGFGMGGRFAEADPARLTQMLQLNIGVLTDLTRLLLPTLASSDRGLLLNVASTAAYQPLPGMAAYAASKSYVLSLTEALSYETRTSPLRVCALCPGPTRTEFFDVVGGDESSFGHLQTAEQVVTAAMQELDKPRPRPSIISGRMNAAVAAVAGRLPRRLVLTLAGKVLK